MKSKILHYLLALLLLTMAGNSFAQKRLYAVSKSAGMIVHSNLDGTDLDTLISGLDQPVGGCPSTKLGRIFWVDSGTQTLNSCNFNGQDRKKLATFTAAKDTINIRGIAVDEINDKVYFIGKYGWGTCNPDGSNLKVRISDTFSGNKIQINAKDSFIFWTGLSPQRTSSMTSKFDLKTGKYSWLVSTGGSADRIGYWGLRFIPNVGKLFSTHFSHFIGFDSVGNFKSFVSFNSSKFIDTLDLVSHDYDFESKNLLYTHGYNGEIYNRPIDSSHHGKYLMADYPFDIYDLFIGESPLKQAEYIQFSNINGYEFKATWNTGQWRNSSVFVTSDTTGSAIAEKGVEYVANAEFGLGDRISGTNWACVYNGTDSNITVTGLNPETTYRMMVLDRMGNGSTVVYNTNTADFNPRNITTGKPFRQADNLKFSKISGNSFKVDWNTGYWKTSSVYVTEDTFGSASPWDKEEFTANTVFGLGGNPYLTNWYCVYNGTDSSVTVTGLDTVKTYRVMVCDRIGSGTSVIYNRSTTEFNPLNVKTANNNIANNILPSSAAVVCSGDFLDTVKGSTPTGGNPPYQYKWLVSTTGVFGVYGNAFGDNTKEWYIPGNINKTSWYKRIVTDGNVADTSEAFLVVVLKKPVKPEFLTYPSYDICVGTMYQNFAATTTPPANSTYKWSAVNAEIYSQGNTKQFALVNFKTAGTAKVIITVDSAGCSNSVEKEFVVGPDTNHVPKVRYFNGDFICELNGVEKYQWGYDTKLELGGYYLSGAINQNYFNITTDTVHHYWVHSTKDGCTQKTYYNTPNSLSSNGLNKLVSTVYPNPSTGMFNVVFNQELGSNTKLRVLNIAGVTVLEKSISGFESQFSLENMPAGVYMVQIMNANAFVSTIKVVKQ